MLRLLNPESTGVASSEISDLFTPPTTQLVVSGAKIIEHSPVNSLNHMPIEFSVSAGKSFLDLQNSYLYVRCKIVDDEGIVMDEPEEGEAKKVALSNLFGETFIRQMQIFYGQDMIYDSSTNHPYLSMVSALLAHDSEYKRTVLAAAGYTEEEKMDNSDDPGFLARVAKSKGEQEFVSRINAPLFSQPLALIPYSTLRILIYPNSPAASIQQLDGVPRDLHVSFLSMKLCVRHLFVHDSALMQISKMIQDKGGVNYSLRHTSVRTFYLSQGRTSLPEHNLFLTSIPRRIFVMFVSSDAYNGNFGMNPFAFKHFNVKSISIETSNGDTFPARPYEVDFNKSLFMRAYYDLFDTLQLVGSGDSCSITPAKFASNAAIFAIDLGCSRDPSVQLLREGSTCIRANFGTPIPNPGVTMIVLSEFDSQLSISAERTCRIDAIA